MTLLLQKQPVEVAEPPSNIQKRFIVRPAAPSRKTGIVRDLVQARLETRVVVDGRRLRFAECTREQVESLYGRTKDAASALMAHAVWLRSVSEAMLVHRAATVADLPEQPRAALMEAKPE